MDDAQPHPNKSTEAELEAKLSEIRHDLNNMLGTIRLSVELMRRTPKDAAQDKSLLGVENCVIRAIDRVKELKADQLLS